ncbi:4909_t:CDS:2 [Funneliformis mosseae]|uniref:4909_t:CDS:1 n=1 Tax=Funneliformis mosseae TaxID=27381 RepID=A0A9N8VE97_FUNMO|nr:4909_t:CDS:2 [Funneliformis mosseae]
MNACRSNSRGRIGKNKYIILNHCVIIPENLLREARTYKGIKVYNTQSTNLFHTYSDQLTRFVNILIRLAEVVQLKLEDIHVYYYDDSSKVAFNKDKALYFNFKSYLELHDDECKFGNICNAMSYWFIMVCHELAHNFALEHNATHEYYFTSYVMAYMSSIFNAIFNTINIISSIINFVN